MLVTESCYRIITKEQNWRLCLTSGEPEVVFPQTESRCGGVGDPAELRGLQGRPGTPSSPRPIAGLCRHSLPGFLTVRFGVCENVPLPTSAEAPRSSLRLLCRGLRLMPTLQSPLHFSPRPPRKCGPPNPSMHCSLTVSYSLPVLSLGTTKRPKLSRVKQQALYLLLIRGSGTGRGHLLCLLWRQRGRGARLRTRGRRRE